WGTRHGSKPCPFKRKPSNYNHSLVHNQSTYSLNRMSPTLQTGLCYGRGAPRPNMPRRKDISKILVIGSGPIIIGQSAEFDYSGTQACKALKAEGYEVVLANSNPATIMTDPELA